MRVIENERCNFLRFIRLELCIFVLIMRLTKDIQKLADECAREDGYFCASYLGKKGDEFIFGTRYSDSEPRTEGLPALVIVKDLVARFYMDVESFSYLEGLKIRDCKKGRQLFREMQRKVKEEDFADAAEKVYLTTLLHDLEENLEMWMYDQVLYDYLEIAERFGLMLEVVKNDRYTGEPLDPSWYYLRLKSDKLDDHKITSADAEDYEIRNLYEEAFPEEERVPWEDLMRMTDAMPLDFTAYYDVDTFVGFTIVMPREDYNWFWYFAVNEALRGKGYGQKILSHIIKRYDEKRLLLDMESPRQECDNLEQRNRRHDFYIRNGFKDTMAEKTFRGVTFTILMKGEGTFTSQDYDNIISELRKFWTVPSEEKN